MSGGWKGFLKKLAHGAKVLGTNISASIALSRKQNELKRALLTRFKVRQLDEIARRYGISLKGAKDKAGRVSILASHLSFKEVISLAKRYKVRYKDLADELDKFKASLESRKAVVKTESRIEEIVNAVKEFRPEPIRNEEDLEKQLYQYLRAKFPKVPIKRQVKVGSYRIDMQVGPCGIELKVPKSLTHLQRLTGQVRDYSEFMECMIALILDIGVIRNMDRYVERIAEQGYIPIIVEGKLKK